MGLEKRADLSAFRWKRDEFPRGPTTATTRRAAPQGPRDTGVFFWFVFFHVKENERMKSIQPKGETKADTVPEGTPVKPDSM
jgi:hypothetical protein